MSPYDRNATEDEIVEMNAELQRVMDEAWERSKKIAAELDGAPSPKRFAVSVTINVTLEADNEINAAAKLFASLDAMCASDGLGAASFDLRDLKEAATNG